MKEDKIANAVLLSVFCLSTVAVVSLPYYVIQYVSCALEWSSSTMNYKYIPLKGCLIKTPEYGWIKEKYFRTNGE